jgi:hypothetical protein
MHSFLHFASPGHLPLLQKEVADMRGAPGYRISRMLSAHVASICLDHGTHYEGRCASPGDTGCVSGALTHRFCYR